MLRGYLVDHVRLHTRRAVCVERWRVVRSCPRRFMSGLGPGEAGPSSRNTNNTNRETVNEQEDSANSTPSTSSVLSSSSTSTSSSSLDGYSSTNPDGPTQSEESKVSQFIGWTVQNGIVLRKRMDEMTAMAAAHASRLGQSLNKITGYHEIEELKRAVVENERRMHEARQAAKDSKRAYDQAVLRRSTSQREVNDLLQRKSSWSEDDVLRFTRLVREDHVVEQEEARTKARALQTDDDVDKLFNELMRSILSRYHEEQAWSDKIRSASTYGQMLVLGMNLFVFISAVVIVEPWKRKRMVQSFEKSVVGMQEEMKALVDGRMQEVVLQQKELERRLEGIRNEPVSPQEVDERRQDPIPVEARLTDDEVTVKGDEFLQYRIPITALAFVGASAVGWILRSWVG